MYNKLGIGPVVGSALLLVVAVVAVIGFQNWYTTFQSTTLVDIDQESSSSNSLQIQGLNYGNLYFKSSEGNISSLRIISEKTGTEMCSFSENGEVNNSGLVGWWTFDDESSIIEDKSGNGNNGTLYGNTRLLLNFDDGTADDKTVYQTSSTLQNSPTWLNSNCISGGCFEFDGINDRIDINYNDTVIEDNLTEFSVSVWVNLKSLNLNEGGIARRTPIISDWNTWDIGNQHGFNLAIIKFESSNPYWRFDVNDGINYQSTPSTSILNSSEFFSEYGNRWVHVIGTFKANNQIRLYVDGLLISNYSTTLDYYRPEYTTPIWIGRTTINSGDLNGSVDEVAIYSKTLSETEVLELYNSQKAKFIEFVDSPIDKAVEFDGIDDYIIINSTQLNINSSMTYFGIFTTPTNFPARIWDKFATGSNYKGIFFQRDENYFTSTMVTDIYYGSNFDFKSNKNVVVQVFNATEPSFTTYHQGILEGVDSTINSTFISEFPLYLGANDGSHGFSKFQLEEFRIYNRSLTSQEVKQLYFYSIKQTNEGTNSIDLSSCNLQDNQPYQIQLFTNEGSVIESRFNN